MKVTRSAKKSAPTPGKVKRPLLAGPLLVAQENVNPPNSTKLLITNLEHSVADSDICELFSEFGCIREVAVHYNCWGYSLGTAHVVFLNHEHAAEAARRYNGVPFDGRPMTITLEGAPHGAQGLQNPLPVKMRLSFGPKHNNNARNPLSQLNAPTRGRPPKGVKRLENGPKGFGGLVKPRGRPAVLANGKSIGRVPTAAELDMELDEYLSQKRKKHVATEDKENGGGFGTMNDLVTPFKSAKKNVPKGTPKTPGMVNGKTPKRTPGRPPKYSPMGSSTVTPKRTPGRPPKNSPTLSPTAVSKATPGKPLQTSQSVTSPKTPKRTPGRPPKVSPKGTPGNHPTTTPFKVKLVRIPTKTPKKAAEEVAVNDASETLAATEEASETLAATEEASETLSATEEASEVLPVGEEDSETDVIIDATEMLVAAEEATDALEAVEEASEKSAAVEDITEIEEVEEVPEEEDSAEIEEIKPDVKGTVASRSSRTAKTPAKAKAPAKASVDTPSRRRLTRAPSKTPSKVEPPKKRKAASDETLEEVEDVLLIEDAETLAELPDLAKSPKKLSKRRSGRFAGGAN